jgi:hypothetical protein
MVADELRRQADDFIELSELAPLIARNPSERVARPAVQLTTALATQTISAATRPPSVRRGANGDGRSALLASELIDHVFAWELKRRPKGGIIVEYYDDSGNKVDPPKKGERYVKQI